MTEPATKPAAPVDLSLLREVCAPVISWYETFLADQRVDLNELDTAVEGLRQLPALGGRLGWAVAIIASGGEGSSIEEVVVAFEVLCRARGLRSTGTQMPGPRAGGSAPPGPVQAEQLRLPGVD